MKKLSLVITIMLFVVLGSISTSFAFSHGGIKWDDNPKQFIEKAKKLGSISNIEFSEKLEDSLPIWRIFSYRDVDEKNYKIVNNKYCLLKGLKNLKNGVGRVKMINIEYKKRGDLKILEAYYSFDDTLLSYIFKYESSYKMFVKTSKDFTKNFGKSKTDYEHLKTWKDKHGKLYWFQGKWNDEQILIDFKNINSELKKIKDLVENLKKKHKVIYQDSIIEDMNNPAKPNGYDITKKKFKLLSWKIKVRYMGDQLEDIMWVVDPLGYYGNPNDNLLVFDKIPLSVSNLPNFNLIKVKIKSEYKSGQFLVESSTGHQAVVKIDKKSLTTVSLNFNETFYMICKKKKIKQITSMTGSKIPIVFLYAELIMNPEYYNSFVKYALTQPKDFPYEKYVKIIK